jgi:hypothetical protein
MFLKAWKQGDAPTLLCFRFLDLPVRLGFVVEFSFQKTLFEENSRRVELRPILDREFTHWQIIFNPVFDAPCVASASSMDGISSPRCFGAGSLKRSRRRWVLRRDLKYQRDPTRATRGTPIVRRRRLASKSGIQRQSGERIRSGLERCRFEWDSGASAEVTKPDPVVQWNCPPNLLLSSSMVEHSAVNRRVVGSSPT